MSARQDNGQSLFHNVITHGIETTATEIAQSAVDKNHDNSVCLDLIFHGFSDHLTPNIVPALQFRGGDTDEIIKTKLLTAKTALLKVRTRGATALYESVTIVLNDLSAGGTKTALSRPARFSANVVLFTDGDNTVWGECDEEDMEKAAANARLNGVSFIPVACADRSVGTQRALSQAATNLHHAGMTGPPVGTFGRQSSVGVQASLSRASSSAQEAMYGAPCVASSAPEPPPSPVVVRPSITVPWAPGGGSFSPLVPVPSAADNQDGVVYVAGSSRSGGFTGPPLMSVDLLGIPPMRRSAGSPASIV
jgi:hypothetical protein